MVFLHFTKEMFFYDFLFAFIVDKALPKMESKLLLQERIISLFNALLSFEKGTQIKLKLIFQCDLNL